MRKRTALITGAIFIFLLLVGFTINELYGFIPEVQLGLLSEKSSTEFDEYDVYEVGSDVVLLCYVRLYEEPNLNLYCFSNTADRFKEVSLNLEENTEASKLFYKPSLFEESFSLIEIDKSTGEWSFGSMDINYDGRFVSILSELPIDAYVMGEDPEIQMLYINFHDFIHSKVALLKYYESTENQDGTDSLVEEVSDFVNDYFENGYMLLYPADRGDIEYLAQISQELGDRVESSSEPLVDYIYQDFLYKFDYGNSIDELLYIDGGKLYKALSFIEGNSELEDKYLETFDNYKKGILTHVDMDEDKLDLFIKYMPVINEPLLDYFNRISSDTERLDNELSTMLYYVCNNMDCGSNISISNVLGEGIK